MKTTECERCREVKECEYVVNPYDKEINDTITWQWLCDDCEQMYRDEI